METDILSLYATRPIVADMAVTSPIITSTTGITLPTTMGERRDNKVSWFNRCNGFSDFFDDTNSFVTTILVACFNIWIAVAPEIRSTDTGANDAENDIIWCFDFLDRSLADMAEDAIRATATGMMKQADSF